jgi:hypothetical protein
VPYVPRVETVKIERAKAAPWDKWVSPVKASLKNPAWRPLAVALRMLAWVPVMLAYIGALYLVILLAYVARHPEVLVTLASSVLDALPSYAAYASKAIVKQVETEIKARLR